MPNLLCCFCMSKKKSVNANGNNITTRAARSSPRQPQSFNNQMEMNSNRSYTRRDGIGRNGSYPYQDENVNYQNTSRNIGSGWNYESSDSDDSATYRYIAQSDTLEYGPQLATNIIYHDPRFLTNNSHHHRINAHRLYNKSETKRSDFHETKSDTSPQVR